LRADVRDARLIWDFACNGSVPVERQVGNDQSQLKILSLRVDSCADSRSRRIGLARNASGGISTTLPSRQTHHARPITPDIDGQVSARVFEDHFLHSGFERHFSTPF